MASTDIRAARTHTLSSAKPEHPFQHTTSLIEVVPHGIDVEEEARLYEELCDSPALDPASDTEFQHFRPPARRSKTRSRPASIFSYETDATSIWLADNSGNKGGTTGFARDVQIVGWTSVGDKLGGAYIVYDCAIFTKEGTVIHTHKRYSAFAQLHAKLRATLPPVQQSLIPALPPKSPLSKFRATFLDGRRRALQHWLASILLHPDIGGCEIVRKWVME